MFNSRSFKNQSASLSDNDHVGAPLWGGALVGTQQVIRRLKMFQMRCLQDIMGVSLWRMRHNVDILEETGELPIKEQLRLQWSDTCRGCQNMGHRST